ncbi:MAG: efflux RND transporter periplasmic adaptor subunit [Pseudomonadota bacterium]|jgi:RND family efflux transporter MFP subunit
MRLRRLPLAVVFVAALALSACSGGGDDRAAPTGDPSLATVVVAPATAARERSWDGVVQAVHQATLAAQTAGRVVELPFDVNDVVKAGDVVVRFTDVEQRSGRAQAEASLRAARAQVDEAEAEQRRIANLAARQLVARSQLDQATARRDAARAALAAAEAGVKQAGERVDYTVVRAPYAGIVTQRHVEIGETVAPGQPLVSGLSLGQLRIEVQVPQADIAAIREHKAATVRLADGRDVEAREVIVFPTANPDTHTFTVRVELPEMDTRLQPGNTVKVRFKLGKAERLFVPATALVRRSEIAAVYVVSPEGRVGLRQIRVGELFGDRVEVIAGLASGEAIALDPVAALVAQRAAREAADE